MGGTRRRRGGKQAEPELCDVCKVSVKGRPNVICCDTCQKWYHFACVDVHSTDSYVIDPEECFSCPRCRRVANGLENNVTERNDIDIVTENVQETQQSQQETEQETSNNLFDLIPFIDPIVPGPLTDINEDADGWGSIDTFGAWECASSKMIPLEEVPGPFRNAWSNALSTVLRRIQQAGGDEEITRALKWFLALPKLLLRAPKRGGKKGQGTGELAARFEAVRIGNWGLLLQFLKKDEETYLRRQANRSTETPLNSIEEKAKLRKVALTLISKGQVGRARRRIVSHGVAPMSNTVVKDAMQSKYPPRSHDMPHSVQRGICVESLPCLKITMLNLESGVAAGFGGLRNEHLRCAAQHWDDNDFCVMEEFSIKYLNGNLPPWFYKVWGSVSTVPLFKSSDQDPSQVRPVGIKNSFVRTLHKEVVKDNRPALREYLEPQQLALAPGGAAKLVHTVRMTLEENQDFVCVCLDMKNAHNEVSRKSVVVGLESQLTLRHLAQHAATCLASHQRLEAGGVAWGEAGQGLTQGDPEAGFSYCVACHEDVKTLDRTVAAKGGKAVFGNDDGYVMGPASVVFPAVEKFARDVKEKHNLTLQVTKTKVYHCSGDLPPEAPPDMPRAGRLINQNWVPGFVCYGVAIGSTEFVKAFLSEKVDTLIGEIDKVMDLLKGDNQSAWILLSTALSQQLDYSLALQYPSDILESANLLDARLWSALEQVCGQHIPKTDEGLGIECVVELRNVPQLAGKSYQSWMVRQPIKLGGLGLRSLVETCPAAFLGGVEMALPHMVGEEGDTGICPQLEGVVGHIQGGQRWKEFIEYGSKTSCEYTWAWDQLKTEADCIWHSLGIDPVGALTAAVEDSGGANVDGKTRREVVEQREGLRHQLMEKALAAHPDRLSRPVTVFPNIADDKVAGRWLLATPGAQLGLSQAVFQEAMSSHLCLPSPAIVKGGWVGKRIGRNSEVIDKFGDSVNNCVDIYGDSFRSRHDRIKEHIMTEAMLSKVHADCEVYGQFADLLPVSLVQDGGELQYGRARQGVTPDFKFLINTPDGPESCLAELKTISAGKSRYPRGASGKGTDRRASLIPGEYERKLWKYDVKYHGTEVKQRGQPEPPPGPLVRRLRSFPMKKLVAGPWGDLSEDFHELLGVFAKNRAEAEARSKGKGGGASSGDLGKCMGDLRRSMSIQVVRSQSLCLLERLSQLSSGARSAGDRRKAVQKLEEIRMRQREAYHAASRNRGLSRLGRAFVP